jgi:alkylated DNA repair dioxygenase AlkB
MDALGGRLVQQFGWIWGSGSGKGKGKGGGHGRTLTEGPPFPKWLRKLVSQISLPFVPDQCIVNKYIPPMGIGAHTDAPIAFGPIICTLSLGDMAALKFADKGGHLVGKILLQDGNFILIDGPVRFNLEHSIEGGDRFTLPDGKIHLRSNRWSVTLRSVNK